MLLFEFTMLYHSAFLHAGGMGFLCGSLHALGPDHLATLVTFSALMPPLTAAKVGASWGLGHCFGVVMIGLLIYGASNIPGVDLTGYESIGDYVIGASMIVVALYFTCQEDKYISVDGDGEETVSTCACCHSQPVDHLDHKKKLCGSYSEKSHSDEEESLEVESERAPLIVKDEMQDRDKKSAVVGFLQGMCCPMGLVQVTYLAGKSAIDTTIFILVCVVVSIVGTAVIAALWASLTRSTVGKAVSPRLVYRTSCFLAFSCGTLWIVANFYHFLDKVNYAEHHMME